MSLHTWLLYLIAVIGLSLTPGPNTLLALTHGAMHGHRKALCTITGGALGFTLVIGLSMLGISALLKAWSPALILLKWIGGAYLVYLGIQLWRAPAFQQDLRRHVRRHGDRPARHVSAACDLNPTAEIVYNFFLR